MQGLPREPKLSLEITHQPPMIVDLEKRRLIDPVQLVADDRMPDVIEVHTNLVLTTGVRPGAHQCHGRAAKVPTAKRFDVGERW